MPYVIRARGDEWCVFKEGEENGRALGCHASRERALAQQRALYANEAQTASAPVPTTLEILPPRIELPVSPLEKLMPSLVAAVEVIANRLVATEDTLLAISGQLEKAAEAYEVDREVQAAERSQWREALTAALQPAPAPEPPIINVHVPVTEVPIPIVNVAAPEIHVDMPRLRKEIKFERTQMGDITKAIVEEVNDAG